MYKCCISLYFFSPLSEVSFIFQEKYQSCLFFPLCNSPWDHGTMKYAYFILFCNCPSKWVKIWFFYWICLLVICKNFHLSAFWSIDRKKEWHWSSFYYCVWRSPSMSLTSEKKNLYVTISLQKETAFVVTLNSSKGSDTFFADWPSRSKNTILCWRSIFWPAITYSPGN